MGFSCRQFVYSPEENEENVATFLRENPDFKLVPVKDALLPKTAPAIRRYAPDTENIEYARRFYPHISDGEGQFLALMQRDENVDVKQRILYKDEAKPLSKQESAMVSSFFKETLTTAPDGRVVKVGDNIVLVSHGCPIPKGSVFMSGVLLGEIKGSTFFPHHQFFSAYGSDFKNKLEISSLDHRAAEYIKGMEIDAEGTPDGYAVLTCDGCAIGGVKVSGGRAKNHYPKGLRSGNL